MCAVETIWNLVKKYKEILLYLIFGVLTTLCNIVSYFVLSDLLHIHYLVANALAWVLSVLFAYVTNRTWVFESKSQGLAAILREMGLFFGCRLLSGVFDMAFMFVAVDLLAMGDMIAKIVSNVVVIVLNYLFSKLIIFKKK